MAKQHDWMFISDAPGCMPRLHCTSCGESQQVIPGTSVLKSGCPSAFVPRIRAITAADVVDEAARQAAAGVKPIAAADRQELEALLSETTKETLQGMRDVPDVEQENPDVVEMQERITNVVRTVEVLDRETDYQLESLKARLTALESSHGSLFAAHGALLELVQRRTVKVSV